MASNIKNRLDKITNTLNSRVLAQEAFTFFVDITPINKDPNAKNRGNAKRSTRLVNTTIEANYPYAGVLDAGRGYRDGQMRGSEQAPKGMSQPTIDHIRDYIFQKTGIRLK